MERQLFVPPPPEDRNAGGGRPSRPRRRKSRGAAAIPLAGLVVAVAVAAALLAACLLAMALPVVLTRLEGDRTNVLLLGIDRRNGSSWAFRTDTIMILTVDPGSGDMGLLSIPRDLQVRIPGRGEDRINTANVYGYQQEGSGGGPELLQKTILANFEIPLDGHVMVDFRAFERIIDVLGGIDVEVPRTLHDTRYPDPRPEDPYAFKTVHFDKGWQTMNGRRALVYARSRMSTSDFDRAKRQQTVLLAIRDRALSWSAVPRWPLAAAAMVDGVKTNLGPGPTLAVALTAVQKDTSEVNRVVLEHPFVVSHRRADGAAVQLPRWELINPVIEGMFGP
jgi:LCP family protein required for cell wall assembly